MIFLLPVYSLNFHSPDPRLKVYLVSTVLNAGLTAVAYADTQMSVEHSESVVGRQRGLAHCGDERVPRSLKVQPAADAGKRLYCLQHVLRRCFISAVTNQTL
jgi:hypothetical protein